jgi:DNA-binding Xre family transcriptional regulator
LSIQAIERGRLHVKLRQAMEEYRRRTGERMTYALLAKRTGLSRPTIESLASRHNYNTRLSTIEKVCVALDCQPADLLRLAPSDGERDANR